MTDLEFLQRALACEHEAVYGYGVVGARLNGQPREQARGIWDAHREQRDELDSLITARKGKPAGSEPAYKLPDGRTPAEIAAALEAKLVDVYLGLAGASDPKLRRYGAQAMQVAIDRQVRWSRSAPAEPFPGLNPSQTTPSPGL